MVTLPMIVIIPRMVTIYWKVTLLRWSKSTRRTTGWPILPSIVIIPMMVTIPRTCTIPRKVTIHKMDKIHQKKKNDLFPSEKSYNDIINCPHQLDWTWPCLVGTPGPSLIGRMGSPSPRKLLGPFNRSDGGVLARDSRQDKRDQKSWFKSSIISYILVHQHNNVINWSSNQLDICSYS